jgi:SepF-like predicted cell division protein (DUF552 family)
LEKLKKENPEQFDKNFKEEYKENIATVMTARSIDARVFSELRTNTKGNLGEIITSIAAGNIIASQPRLISPIKGKESSNFGSKKSQNDDDDEGCPPF